MDDLFACCWCVTTVEYDGRLPILMCRGEQFRWQHSTVTVRPQDSPRYSPLQTYLAQGTGPSVRTVGRSVGWRRGEVTLIAQVFFIPNRYVCVLGHPWETYSVTRRTTGAMDALGATETMNLLQALPHPFVFGLQIMLLEETYPWKNIMSSGRWSWLIDDVYTILETGESLHNTRLTRKEPGQIHVPPGFHHRNTHMQWLNGMAILMVQYGTASRWILVQAVSPPYEPTHVRVDVGPLGLKKSC